MWNGGLLRTDTIPNTFFLEKELNVERVVRPLTFLPITKEEIELLQIGIEKSDGCNSYSAEPLSKIIGYVKTTLVYKH
ncbi:MAG: hypothetical protein C0523_05030 [Cytophaga sp.]|nr:hypothetical protein [Cytophaga sp.]